LDSTLSWTGPKPLADTLGLAAPGVAADAAGDAELRNGVATRRVAAAGTAPNRAHQRPVRDALGDGDMPTFTSVNLHYR
jgi:hypothetical protein